MRFGKSLSKLLEEKKISVIAFAKDLKMSRQGVYLWLQNRTAPDFDTLLKLAKYFNVSFDELITGEKLENKPLRDSLGLSEEAIENLKKIDDKRFLNDFLSNKKTPDFFADLTKKIEEYNEAKKIITFTDLPLGVGFQKQLLVKTAFTEIVESFKSFLASLLG